METVVNDCWANVISNRGLSRMAEMLQGRSHPRELHQRAEKEMKAGDGEWEAQCVGQHGNPSSWGVEAGLWVQVQLGLQGKTFFIKRREVKALCTALIFHTLRRFSYVYCQQKSGTKRESSWPGNMDSGSSNTMLQHDNCSTKFDSNRTKKAMNQDTLNTLAES